jgi:hypothetical protein
MLEVLSSQNMGHGSDGSTDLEDLFVASSLSYVDGESADVDCNVEELTRIDS